MTVHIADNRVGIPENKLDQVFEEGYTTGGTSLGLTGIGKPITAA